MFSAWRKLTKKQDEKPVFPNGVVPIDEIMQKKYAKGVQYNCEFFLTLLINLDTMVKFPVD